MEKILRGVPILKQQGYELCWAACLEMIFCYFNPHNKIAQFEIVARQYGLSNISDVLNAETGKIKPIYNKSIIADEIIKICHSFSYYIERIFDVQTYWATIKSEIMQNRPLIANIGFHYVVVVGFSENTEGDYFFYNDPKKDTLCKKQFIKNDTIQIDDDLLIIKY
jgi:ABC-type bacteriocin/lantibiotic exporter with double-glycine peptidase domain